MHLVTTRKRVGTSSQNLTDSDINMTLEAWISRLRPLDKTARHQIVVRPRASTPFAAPIDHRHTDMTEAIGQLSLLF